MKTEETYPPPTPVEAVELAEIRTAFAEFQAIAGDVETKTIRGANLLRLIGIHAQGLARHEHMQPSCYQRLRVDLPKALTFEKIQACIKIANQSKDGEFETFQETLDAQQLVFQVGGFLQLPERTAVQQSHSTVAFHTFVFNALSGVKDKIEKRMGDAESLTPAAREIARKELDSFKGWLVEIESKLTEGRAA